MTGRWLTPNAAREALGLTWDEFNELIKSGALTTHSLDDTHLSVSEASVNDYLFASELAAPGGDDLAEHADAVYGPFWPRWTAAQDPTAHDDQGDYDLTPNDEGDEQQ